VQPRTRVLTNTGKPREGILDDANLIELVNFPMVYENFIINLFYS
jgi:hypothetical protein